MPKGLVVTGIANKIEWATHNGKGLITGNRKEVTNQAIKAVMEHMNTAYERHDKAKERGFFAYKVDSYCEVKELIFEMDILNDRVVITRKEHHCHGCARKFPKGSKLQVITSVNSSEISRAYWCSTCQEYWNEHMEYGDTITYGELKIEDSEGWELVRKKVENAG